MTEVGNVYGESLYELAKEENLTKLIGDQLAVLQQAFRQEPDFIRLLSSPNLTKMERCQILDDSIHTQNTIVLIVMFGVGITAVREIAHIALFGENLQEIQKIAVNLTTEAVVQNLAAFLLGHIGGGKQANKIGIFTETLRKNCQFSQQRLGELLLQRQSIQRFAVNISYLGHT